MSIAEYKRRRDFSVTPEPDGKWRPNKREPIFVIQEHDASTLHYDLRLLVAGVLKSWAIPKGPSTDPSERRLAIRTEDHPVAYADFEGVIPHGQYGAGTVLLWDRGTYRNMTLKNGKPVSAGRAIRDGHLLFFLEGSKLRGGYALQRFESEPGEKWLLVKADDEYADARRNPVSSQPKSVASGKTLKEIADDMTMKGS